MQKIVYKRIIAVQVIIIIAGFGFVQSAFAGYSDIEISADNSIGASSLDAEVISGESELQLPEIAENMLSGDSVERIGSIKNVGGVDFQYNVSFAKVSGDDELCENLQLEAKVETTSEETVYTGNLSTFVTDSYTLAGGSAVTDDWTFTITAPDGVPMGKDCSFEFIYTAWQTSFPAPTQGWIDTEEIDNNIIHTGVQTPVQTGYNVNDEGDANSYPTPRDPNEFACTDGVTNINGVSVHWTDVAHGNNDIKYQREYKKEGAYDWRGSEIYTNPYTNYRTFGGNPGNDGTYGSRVRAFVDANDNNRYDSGELYSEWSNECSITFDGTIPTVPSGLQRIAPDEGQKVYECGDVSKIQKMHPNWDDNTEDDFDYYEYTSFNAPNGTIGLDEERMDDSIFEYNGSWLPHDGTYGFAVRAVDTAGNKSEWALSDKTLAGSCQITYDSTAPDVEITTPSDDGLVSGTVDIRGTVEDAHPHHYWLVVENSTGTRVAGPGVVNESNSFTDEQLYSWNTIALDEGEYTIKLEARDALDNKDVGSTHWITVTVDNTAPTTPEVLGFLNPTLPCGAITDIHNTTVDWSDSTDTNGISGYQYSVDYPKLDGTRGLWQPFFASTNSQYSGSLNEGIHYIKVRAKDSTGNYSEWSNECNITADWTAPELTIDAIKYPDGTIEPDKFVTSYSTPTIVGEVIDATEAISVTLTVNSETYNANLDGDTWEVDIDDELPDGTHTLSVEAIDIVGNVSTQEKDIFIDTVAPNAEHTFYIDGDEVTESIAVLDTDDLSRLSFTGEYTDPSPSAGLYWDSYAIFEAQDDGSFRFSHDDKKAFCSWRREPNLVDISDEDSFSLTDPEEFSNCEASLPDGEYYIAHHIYDYATRWDIPSINQFRDVLGLHFIVDAPPAIPADMKILDHNSEYLGCDGETDNRSITVDWDDNNESDIDYYDYQIREGTTIAHPEVSHYSGNIRDEDGDYKYRVRAVDESGNESDWTDWCGVTLDRSDDEGPAPDDVGHGQTPDDAGQGDNENDDKKDTGTEEIESMEPVTP